MQTLRMVDRRSLARTVVILVCLTDRRRDDGAGQRAGVDARRLLVRGRPRSRSCWRRRSLRIDLRQDLRHLELLKTWPVKASAVVRGEMLWPGVVITVVRLDDARGRDVPVGHDAVATSSLALADRRRRGAGDSRAGAGVRAAARFTTRVALIFPAWVPLGNQRPRGLDAMGQRLIMLGGTWLLLIISMLPGAIAGGIVWFALRALRRAGGAGAGGAGLPVIVAVEVLLATEALGPAYERLDCWRWSERSSGISCQA